MLERERMANEETGGDGRYFSKRSAKMSAMNHALDTKQRRKAVRWMFLPCAMLVSWSEIFDNELTLRPERCPPFDGPEFLLNNDLKLTLILFATVISLASLMPKDVKKNYFTKWLLCPWKIVINMKG